MILKNSSPEHKDVTAVFFNGAKAEQLFKKNSIKDSGSSTAKAVLFQTAIHQPRACSTDIRTKIIAMGSNKTFSIEDSSGRQNSKGY